jgi:hypothetical protein
MIRVKNLEEAKEFFISNSAGNVVCIKDGQERVCSCYADAKEIFSTENIEIKVNKIVPNTVEHFTPEGESLGFLNEYENNDLRIQIAKANAEGYYAVYEGEKIDINTKGEMSTWPHGMYDMTMRQFAKLFKERGYVSVRKTSKELSEEFDALDGDVEKWKFISRYAKDRNIIVRLDNDDTYALMPADEGEDDHLLQFNYYIGNSSGVYDLLEAMGIKAEGV